MSQGSLSVEVVAGKVGNSIEIPTERITSSITSMACLLRKSRTVATSATSDNHVAATIRVARHHQAPNKINTTWFATVGVPGKEQLQKKRPPGIPCTASIT